MTSGRSHCHSNNILTTIYSVTLISTTTTPTIDAVLFSTNVDDMYSVHCTLYALGNNYIRNYN